ncbi:MAG: non-heme Fe2+,alpha-ketoglutarate-dependent halogenase [Saprospiraceae bacterium]|jgi:non-heme Fe2+,alpha-ketoglutarate-dependent halogenase
MRQTLNQGNYFSRGIDWPIKAFDAAQAADFYQRFVDFQHQSILRRGKETHIKPHLVSTWLDRVTHHPAIVEAVKVALGPNIVLWTSDFANKEAGAGTFVPWHQDTPYWNLSDTKVVSVWLALSESKKYNGAMRVFPATHNEGALGRINIEGDPHEAYKEGTRTSSEGNIFAYDHIMDKDIDESLASDVELDPGQFSLHNIQLLHGGGPNESDHDRVGFVMRFISADTFCNTGLDSVTPISGNCERDHFVLEERPDADFSDQALNTLQIALQYPSGFGDRKVQ